uniref:Uncharacterized protein n=1 Tax=Pristionchus pacificus TaxID=54126 RepID=A0A2A6B3X2_PRIPA|eukprot:PDM60579.1 hypothetical protein PRIPAC_53557 [Pristionchus pacificus]
MATGGAMRRPPITVAPAPMPTVLPTTVETSQPRILFNFSDMCTDIHLIIAEHHITRDCLRIPEFLLYVQVRRWLSNSCLSTCTEHTTRALIWKEMNITDPNTLLDYTPAWSSECGAPKKKF